MRDEWAPDITFVDGQYRLYYAISDYGTMHSAIGLATNVTLDRTDPNYMWMDRGIIVRTERGDSWNAIDPAAFVDQDRPALAGRGLILVGS